jgi:hypothetical protein
MNARSQPAVHGTQAAPLLGRRTALRRFPPDSALPLRETAKRLGRAAATGEMSLCAAVERLLASAVDPLVSPVERDALLRIALATYVASQREQPITREAPWPTSSPRSQKRRARPRRGPRPRPDLSEAHR